MGKFNLNRHLTVAKPLDNGMMWYECAEYADVKEYIKTSIQKIKENFVSIGYWLKYANDKKMYLEDGYSGIEEFAASVYGISKSTAYRMMEINTEFSKDGNSPELAEKYKDFSKSQLQELLSLTTEQREVVTPDMTVSEIRDIKKNIKKENHPDGEMASVQNEQEDEILDRQLEIINADMEILEHKAYQNDIASEETVDDDIIHFTEDDIEVDETSNVSAFPKNCITGLSKYGNCNCCGSAGITCCAQCDADCNVRCGWIDRQETQQDTSAFDEEVLSILSYTSGDAAASIPFMNEEDMFIFGEGEKSALTMKLQKYLAAQISLIDLSKYRLEIRAVKIK